jgi:hypothetical protein
MGIDENAFQTAFKGAIDGFSIKSLRTFLEIYEAAKASEQPVGSADLEKAAIQTGLNLADCMLENIRLKRELDTKREFSTPKKAVDSCAD